MKNTNSVSRFAAVLCAFVAASPAIVSANSTGITWAARFATFRGAEDCKYGDSDCNRCVYNVESQFRAITRDGAVTENVHLWDMEPNSNYEPSGRTPKNITSLLPTDGAHFQSFVRAPTDKLGSVPTLFSAYGGPGGGMFAIGAGAELSGQVQDGELLYAYTAKSDHIGGMQAIGHKLIAAHYDGSQMPILPDGLRAAGLQFLDIDTMPDTAVGNMIYFPMFHGSKHQIANVSAIKLAGGGYLLVTMPTSGANEYKLLYTASLDDVHLEEVQQADVVGTWASAQGGFENLSAITECGTGKTFIIGATGPEFAHGGGTYAGDNPSTWALYELTPGAPSLKFITRNTRKMYNQKCDPRASGTAFAAKNGQLALYCHQHARDPNARVSGIGCAVGIVSTLFSFGFGAPALAFCVDAWKPDSEILYTEYMADVATPEAPPPSSIPVTINLSHMSTFGERLGVISGTGEICEVLFGTVANTCTFHVPYGTSLKLAPYGGPSEHIIKWESGNCPNSLSNGNANLCASTITKPTTFTLEAITII